VSATGDGHVLSICDKSDNDNKKKESFEKKKTLNIGRGMGLMGILF
jgi:hypothetical protein